MPPISRAGATEMTELAQEFARSAGVYFFPEDLHAQAFELAIEFGKIALAVRGTEAPAYGASQEEAKNIGRLADSALTTGSFLIRKIPMSALTRLEREHRSQLEPKAPRPEKRPMVKSNIPQRAARRKFWQDVEIEEPKYWKKQTSEWGLATLEHFKHRPLTTTDLAKVIFGNQFAYTPINNLQMRVNNSVFRSEKVKEALGERGLELKSVGASLERVYVCEEIGGELEVDRTARPTDDELRALAIQLRQMELDRDREPELGPDRISAEIEKTWLDHEAERSRLSDSSAAGVARGLYKMDAQVIQDDSEAEVQAKKEIRGWQKLRSQQDVSWSEHEKPRQDFYKKQQRLANIELNIADRVFIKEKREAEKQAKQEIQAWKQDETAYLKQALENELSWQEKVAEHPLELEAASNPLGLTSEEIEILKRLPLGKSDTEIARELYLSVSVVKTHMKRSFNKTKVKGRMAAASLAYETYKDELAPLIDIDLTRFDLLSPAEGRVFVVLGEGLSSAEIARRLDIGLDTVTTHLSSIYKKLGISRMQAGIFLKEAQKAGLLDTVEKPQTPIVKQQPQTARPPMPEVRQKTPITTLPPSLTAEVWEQRKRPRFGWEIDLEQETERALTLLGRSGFSKDPHATIKIKDGPILRLMIKQGFITEQEAEHGKLSLSQAVKAMLLGTSEAKKRMLGAETKSLALKNISEQIAGFIRMASEPKK